ncbi:MAG: DUF883 family protein [Alphaproteobacteria bacterium]|nr:DUF883 family protein [Alphaproteobacteria bacterium]
MPKAKTSYPEIDDIREDLDSLKSNVVELTKHLKHNGQEQSHELREMATERLDALKTSGRKQVEVIEKRVKQKPVESIGIAFATGLALSYILGRR